MPNYRTLFVTLSAISVLFAAINGFASTSPRPSIKTPQNLMYFEKNVGQAQYDGASATTKVDAIVRVNGTLAYVHGKGLQIAQTRVASSDKSTRYEPDFEMDVYRVDMDLIGSNPNARVEYGNVLPGVVRYINQHTGVRGLQAERIESLTYREVYPKIDLRMYLTPAGVKYDFVVHPGGDPRLIAMKYTGGTAPTLTRDGGITITTPLGKLSEQAPIVFTASENKVSSDKVQAAFDVSGQSVRFSIGTYDLTKTLVIDPQRIWATYLGGSVSIYSNPGSIVPISVRTAFDSTGNVYLAGTTQATDMPNSAGVLQRKLKGGLDCFIAKFSESGKFQWYTYYGGSQMEILHDLATDPAGGIWAVGETKSRNLPDSFQVGSNDDLRKWPDSMANTAGFVIKLATDGKWADSWLVDDRENDRVTGICVTKDKLALTGYTNSPTLGGMNGDGGFKRDSLSPSQYDTFLALFKLNTQNRWNRNYHIFYGGDGMDYGGKVVIDADGNAIFTGLTTSLDLRTTDGTVRIGNDDNFVVKFGTTPTRLWATMFGSKAQDQVCDLAVDSKKSVVVIGYSKGADFPTTAGALRTTFDGFSEGYIRKYASDGKVDWSTFYGGSGDDYLYGIAVDGDDNIWVSGTTHSIAGIPITTDAFQSKQYSHPSYDLQDGFLGKLDPVGKKVLYGSYYGAPPQDSLPKTDSANLKTPPPNTDYGTDDAFDIACYRSAYISIATAAETFRMSTTTGAFQDSAALYQDTTRAHSFISYFSQCKDTTVKITPNGPPTLCDVDARQLLAPTGYVKYQWSTGETNRVITVKDTGTYTVTCVTPAGCRYRDTIRIGRNPKPSINAGRDTSVCIKSSVQLNAIASGGKTPYRYKWNRVETGSEFIDKDSVASPIVNPGTTSRYEVTVTDSNGCSAKDTVLVSVTDPKPTAVPNAVEFGSLDACTSSAEQDITIFNPQDYEVRITGMTPDDPRLSVVTNLGSGLAVPPKGSATIRVRITASSSGLTTGSFTITGSPCSWGVRATYSVTKAQLTAVVIPGTISFGAGVECDNTPKTDSVVIKNRGLDPLIVATGIVSAPYTIVSPTTDVTIKAGQELTVQFQYTPTLGSHSADAKFPFTSGTCKDTLRVKLNAVTSPVNVTADVSSVDVGTLSGCDSQRDTIITVTNNSDVAVDVTLPNDPEVVYTPAGPLTIAAKSSVTINASVRPGSSGAFTKTSTLNIEPCKKTLDVTFKAQKNGIAFTTPAAVDFGEFSSCSPGNSTTRTASLTFDGTGSASVKSVTTGPSISTTLAQGSPLTPGTPLAFNVTWTPAADGLLIDSIVVTFDPCDVRRVIRVNGVRTSVSLRADNPVTSLGIITGTATGTVKYTNTGTDTLIIGLRASTGTAVTATRPASIAALLPGAQVEVDFLTGCDKRTTISDTIEAIATAPCVVSAVSIINATCEQSKAVTTVLSVDSVGVKVGDQFTVPIRIRSSSGLNAANAKAWTATITYDPMVVVGRTTTPDCYVPASAGPCTASISGVRGADTVGVLSALNFTAVLGTSDVTSLVLSDFRWTDAPTAVITSNPGHVKITNICTEGGSRFLKPRTAGYRLAVYPTPATSDLTIEASGLDRDILSWHLSSFLGERAASGVLSPDQSGAIRELIDVRTLPAGMYTLVVEARGETLHTTILVQR